MVAFEKLGDLGIEVRALPVATAAHLVVSDECVGHMDEQDQIFGFIQLTGAVVKGNGVDRAIIFPMDDPKTGNNFAIPNERILKAYKEHPTKFIPFFRLNPNYEWEKEFQKRVEQGFFGVKLHPRSQNFEMNSAMAMKLYKRIEKENLMLLIHAGFGLDYVADDLNQIARKFPKIRLIVGHGGFPELQNVMKLLRARDNVLFDTSTMRVFDLVELLKRVSYKKMIFGSDIPLYDQTLALQMLVDSATLARQTPNQIRSILGENIQKWLK